MILYLLVLIPLVFACVVAAGDPKRAKWIATVGTLLPVPFYVLAAFQFPWLQAGYSFEASVPWLSSLGVTLSVGVDSVAMLLIGLTVLLGPVAVICSFTAIEKRPATYYGWLLVLQAAMTGVFAARDLVFFYINFEFTLVPLYILINLYGSKNRRAAATKFFLFTFTGSLITLAGLVYIAWKYAAAHGEWSFQIDELGATALTLSPREQAWLFWSMLLGFAIKVPLFPVHTWLPLAHTEAPTAGSVILAAVLLKLGTYGIYRFVIPYAPEGAIMFAPVVGVLAVIGILYAGLICWVQRDIKKLIAYSSVSHLGFCVLGLFAFNGIGLSGSVLYMLNHGLSTGALFLLIGMIYERYHTRDMDELGGLAGRMPVWATFMVFFTLASVGLPGLNGFVGEFMCVLGAVQSYSGWEAAAGWGGQASGLPGELGPYIGGVALCGVIITAMYLFYMLGLIVWGKLREPAGHHAHAVLPVDLNAREIGVLTPLAILCVFLGLYPTPVLRALEGPTNELAALVQTARESRMARLAEPDPGAAALAAPEAIAVHPGSESRATSGGGR
jgi:NADH-quinone oxidoreductase subunit M